MAFTAQLSGTRQMRLSSTVILQHNGDLLLILRKCKPFQNYWALVGGAKRSDESFLDCAIRKVKEEVGIHLRVLVRVDEILVNNELGEQFSQVYIAKIIDEDVESLKIGKEVLEADLIHHTKLPEPIVPFHKEVIERFFSRQNALC